MRLIDADKLLEIYKKWIPQLLSKEDEGDRRGVETCIAVLEDMQTVDAVPAVRCRDCKYWGDEDGKLQHSDGVLFARCKIHNYLLDGRYTGWCPTENDFCSYGERKEGADNGEVSNL